TWNAMKHGTEQAILSNTVSCATITSISSAQHNYILVLSTILNRCLISSLYNQRAVFKRPVSVSSGEETMLSRIRAVSTLTIITATLLSIIGMAGSVSAQSGDYVKTFALPTKSTTDGAYAGVDPSGATVTYWHNQPGNNQKTLEGLIATFNQGNPWKIAVKPV